MKTENGNGNRIIRKRIKSAIICLLMALSLAVSNFAGLNLGGVKAHAALSGAGTSVSPYQITSYEDLVEFAQIVNGTHTSIDQNSAAWAKLMDNIECKYQISYNYDTNWVPIGDDSHKYTGTFDGQGYTITGLNNTGVSDVNQKGLQGLFGWVGTGGNVQNVGLKDSDIRGKDSVGGLAGFNLGQITDCNNKGKVTGSNNVGGVVGENHGTITRCYNTGEISGSGYVGGVVGLTGSSGTGNVADCYNTGTVTGLSWIGGIVGENHKPLERCYNTGEISGSDNVGGVVGETTSQASITDCYNIGAITATRSDSYAGGIVGQAFAAITKCYNSGMIHGKNHVGGVVGFSNVAGRITNCYNTGMIIGQDSVGGLNGEAAAAITNSYNIGMVKGNKDVGGVAGISNAAGPITNCYNTGMIIGQDYVGGLNGVAVAAITNSYNIGMVKGNNNVGGLAGEKYSNGAMTNCYNAGIVIGRQYVGCIYGVGTSSITSCYYDKSRSMLEKAIGSVESDPETVKGLTTAEMTGSTAFTKMVFSYADENQNPWMAKADSSSGDTSYWYYPHLKGFNFNQNNQQMGAASIAPADWPAKIAMNIIPSGDLSVDYNGNEQKLPGNVIQNAVSIPEGATASYSRYVNGSFGSASEDFPTDPGVYKVEITDNNVTVGTYIITILAEGTDKDYTIAYQKKTGTDSVSGEDTWENTSSVKDVGEYKAIISFTEKINEKIEKVFEITSKTIAVSANSGSKVYGEEDPALTYTSDALIGNDSFTGSLSRVSGENTGEYDIEINTLSAGGNYNINYTGAKLTITPKSLGSDAIRLSAEEFEYDGTAKTPEVSVYDGNNKIPDSEFTYRILNNVNAGTATVEVSDAANGNYTVSGTKTFRIKEALVTVTADDKSKVYGEADPVFTATVTGLKGNDTADLITYTFSRTEGENTGTYAVTPSGNEIQGNYKVSYVPGTLVINKKLAGIKTAPAAFTGLKYSGNEQKLVQTGTAEDSCTILYALGKNAVDVPIADAEGTSETEKTWKTTVPTGKNAGTYYVWYKVASDKNHTGSEAACIPVTISKADPEYVVPTGLKIETGKKLSDISLPEHWSWADPGQSVGNAGSNTFKAVYTPVDTDNYNVVNSIDVTVEVTEPEPEPEPEQEPNPDPDPAPETPSGYTNKYVYAYNVGDQPKTTNNTTDSNNKTEKTVNNPDGSVSKITTVKNPDNSVTTITETTGKDNKVTKTTETVKKYPSGGVKTDTKTEYPDGTVKTEKKTEYSNGNTYYKSTVKDKNGNTVSSTKESTVFSPKGTKTYTSTIQNSDGSNSKTYIRETAAGKKTEKQYSFDAEGNGTYSVTNSNKNGVTFSESFDITGTDAVLISFFTNKKKATVPKTILVAGIERLITAIAEGAFKGNTSIKNIRVEADITTIAESAFSGAINLKKLFLPATLTNIGKNAFAGIPKLTIYIKADDKKAYDEAAKTLKQLLKKAGIDPDIITIKREK